MKKRIAFFILLFLLVSSSVLCALALEPLYYAPADVDCDGIATSDDAIYLLYHTLNSSAYPIPDQRPEEKLDLNGDGLVSSDDAIYLLFYTMLPEDYPLYPQETEPTSPTTAPTTAAPTTAAPATGTPATEEGYEWTPLY